jgi:fido (protein-threonine AMPylation protein)
MIIRELSKKIDSVAALTEAFGGQVRALTAAAERTFSLLNARVEQSDKQSIDVAPLGFATNQLTVDLLLMLHRALLFDAPPPLQVGMLRSTKVWIGAENATLDTATFVPPEPELVRDLLEKLLSQWRDAFPRLLTLPGPQKVSEITRFHHHFLQIHPFMDGNGRIARLLLEQQAKELLHRSRRIVIEDTRPYQDALAKAHHGDYSNLEALVTQAIYGVEFIPGSPCEMSGQSCPSCKVGVMDIDPTGSGVRCGSCGLLIAAVES